MTQQTLYNVIYYVGAPLFIGLVTGWGQSPAPEFNNHINTALYFAGYILIGWLGCVSAMALGKSVLAPWRPPLWALSILPPLMFGWLALIPMNFYLQLTEGLVPPSANLLNPLPIEWTSAFFKDYVFSMVSVLVLFCGANYLFQFLGLQRFGYEGEGSETVPPIAVAQSDRLAVESIPFIALLPKELRGEPLIIQAQEHYINIRTVNGSKLLKYPFGNAVKSLDGVPGIQVHRSYWVNDQAVIGVAKVGQRHFVQMDDGKEIPISQSYRRSVREHFADHFASVESRDA